jgi:cell wall-associated NlpC family hydrolase
MSLMTPDQFVSRAVGIPWERWRSDWAACDCYGLVILYFREVLGIDLGTVPQSDIATGFFGLKCWVECEPEAGASMWMAWKDGAPTHAGILVSDDMVLHSTDIAFGIGSVRLNRLSVINRSFSDAKFFRHSPC